MFPGGGFHAAAAVAAAGLGGFGIPHGGRGGGPPPPQYPGAGHPHANTMAVAASQAASLGMHPATSAAWWSMASHLAAQDYLSRLQASGMNFPGPDLQYPLLNPQPVPKASSKSQKSNSKKEKNNASQNMTSIASTSSCNTNYQKSVSSNFNSHKPFLTNTSYSSKSDRVSSSPMMSSSGKMKAPKSSIMSKDISMHVNSGNKPLPPQQSDTPPPRPRDSPAAMSFLSDPSAILGGVRLPPDTEIIKYTSSIVGPKIPGTTNRGRKKTISLDPPTVSLTASLSSTGLPLNKMKRSRMDTDYSKLPNAHQNEVEVIKLPPSLTSTNGIPPAPPSIHKHMLNLLSKPLTDPNHRNIMADGTEAGLNLSVAGNSGDKDETPLNLSLKSSNSTSAPELNSSLNSLTNITVAVGNNNNSIPSSGDRVSRRKPGAKPRRVIQEPTASNTPPMPGEAPRPPRLSESPRPSSGGEENDMLIIPAHSKEGRPRNLGRGVSKPKKNTVASLLAQSRALGIKPILSQQYSAEDMEKLKQVFGDGSGMILDTSTDSEGAMEQEAGAESEGDVNLAQHIELLRVPLEQGWKRDTIIHGLTKSGGLRGEVTYQAPGSATQLKNMSQILPLLENTGLTKENFSFSSKSIVGSYLQVVPSHLATEGEYIRMNEESVLRRLDDMKSLARTSVPILNVDHRIELARQQQAVRDAKKQAREELARSKEQARNAREQERAEQLEAQRKEREIRNQQLMEERELNRQHAALLKEQMYLQELNKQKEVLYTVERERDRRRQHMAHIKALEARRKLEEREKRKHQAVLDKLINREKIINAQRKDAEILTELRKPQEDSEIPDATPLPDLPRVKGLNICGQAFADVLMVFEFLHNFGETLGFDMESLPTLQSLQSAIEGNCGSEPEEELLSVMTHLLVCAIEDPGIPNPARHTTILGQSLRQADITHINLSEILRIYLYANATGEVKALTGVNFERDREKRVADHLQNDNEMVQTSSGKNAQFYEYLHENPTWKLSESLKDCPFLALNPTTKAEILAFLCNELLQNKTVLKQIDNSHETVAHLRKEKYILDGKIKKYKSLHMRKMRIENNEKCQTITCDKLQSNSTRSCDGFLDNANSEHALGSPAPDGASFDEHPPISTPSAPSEGVEEEMLSDVESEDEDKNLNAEEISKKLEKLQRTSSVQSKSLQSSCLQLRATCHGQDRYWRRYWSLATVGGIWVEGMESAQPEIMDYHKALEMGLKRPNGSEADEDAPKEKIPKKEEIPELTPDQIQSKLELQSIKSSLNLSDHTQIIKYEPNMMPGPKEEGPIKMEEKYIQEKNESEMSEMLDIEDSIPTAFLVQKPNSNKHIYVEETPKVEAPTNAETNSAENASMNDETSRNNDKTDCINSEAEPNKTENSIQNDCKNEDGNSDPENKIDDLKNQGSDDSSANEEKVCSKKSDENQNKSDNEKENDTKWFSILQRQLTVGKCLDDSLNQQITASQNLNCDEVHNVAGNRWDISNNLQFFNLTGLDNTNNINSNVPVSNENIDSSLTLSGLDASLIDSVVNNEINGSVSDINKDVCQMDTDSDIGDKDSKNEVISESTPSPVNNQNANNQTHNVPNFINFNISSLSAYLQCDSPSPLPMTADEQKELDNVKLNGLPKKLEKNFVPLQLRHGWWHMNDSTIVQNFLDALQTKGLRERELRKSILLQMDESGKIDLNGTLEPAACIMGDHPSPEGFVEPDVPGSSNKEVAQRIDAMLLEQVEALEDKVANASMQVKGWSVPPRDVNDIDCVPAVRERLLGLEAAIERRYLKPPLGANTGDPNLAAITQEPSQSSTTSPDNESVPKGLLGWRESVTRCHTSAQLAMCLYMLEASVAWDKSIMRANCQFCHSGDSEDQLLLCDGCDKGYHTYCFKPKMDRIPEGDWYCFECLNKATGERNCIVCGGRRGTGPAPVPGKLLLCELCPRAYHQDCHSPPILKSPRGKWYCSGCISRAPPSKKRVRKPPQNPDIAEPPPSPALSHASVSYEEFPSESMSKSPTPQPNQDVTTVSNKSDKPDKPDKTDKGENRKERQNLKKLNKEMSSCKQLLEEMEIHEDSWPFLLPVNTKQFPTYKKIIKTPMDLSTIKKKITDLLYKSRDDFVSDVRQIFNNCEVFNEDDSPVGKAGHGMRRYFESRWSELCPDKS